MNAQPPHVDVEPLFDGFIRSFGGNLVREYIGNVNPPRNADYFFRSPPIVAELKCIERDAITTDEVNKLQQLFSSWMNRGLVVLAGTNKISMREVPESCQREWLALMNASRKRRLAEANEQIKKTKSLLDMSEAKGVLFLVNDAKTSLEPYDEMNLVARILQAKKPDGTLIYSHLHWIIHFSVNPKTVNAQGYGMNFWLPCFRENGDIVMQEFVDNLRIAWIRYHGQQLGIHSFEVPADPPS
jgi:hypothetical protein